MTLLLEKHFELARRAYMGTSFDPDGRARRTIEQHSNELKNDLEAVADKGGDIEAYRQRYESLFCAWLSAMSRCISTMIAGPAKFPVRRAQKANQSEQKRWEEFSGFRTAYFERLAKRERAEARKAADPIAELADKINAAETLQKTMVAANKVIRKGGDIKAGLLAIGLSEGVAAELMQPDCMGRIGFPSYQLTNNNANIKRMKARLAELQAKAQGETQEIERPDGVKIVANKEADRLQLFFQGKPDSETIGKLKRAAFKWSPSNGCWQRPLTGNAVAAAKNLLG